jgi:hypothetical protein
MTQASAFSEGKHILIVDDSEVMRRSLRALPEAQDNGIGLLNQSALALDSSTAKTPQHFFCFAPWNRCRRL